MAGRTGLLAWPGLSPNQRRGAWASGFWPPSPTEQAGRAAGREASAGREAWANQLSPGSRWHWAGRFHQRHPDSTEVKPAYGSDTQQTCFSCKSLPLLAAFITPTRLGACSSPPRRHTPVPSPLPTAPAANAIKPACGNAQALFGRLATHGEKQSSSSRNDKSHKRGMHFLSILSISRGQAADTTVLRNQSIS